ncbi:MAG: MBOAT family O-acyltransferase [Lachnospiraceae bacterium]|nr:MBOAT family O-acyltransferase [Lachnospiraceae bacterium]
MSFNTYFFVLVFLPIAVIGYHMINRGKHFEISKCFLLLMSVWFYFMSGWQGGLVVLGLTLINYAIYKLFIKQNKAKLFCVLGIIIDVLVLAYFKYLGSFTVLGISFITFSQISFIVDSYKEYDEVPFVDYLLYILFFPKVVMGPIALSRNFIPQINDVVRKETNFDNIAKGLYAFAFGLAKKVLLADLLSGYVGYAYDYTPILGMTNAWIAVLAYTLQIYFDFSGFCDMATGIGLMLNFDIPDNFLSPYRSLSIGEFWDRWHITLTKFFTKYIYIPLGGNRKGVFRTYLNIMIVFLISGIWHGSTINFVIWGIIHGILSCISRIIKPIEDKIPKWIRWTVTFICVNLAWVYFRAPSLAGANLMIKELFSFKIIPVDANFAVHAFPAELEIVPWLLNKFTKIKSTYYFASTVSVLVVAFGLFAATKMKNTRERLEEFKATKGNIAITVLLLVWSVMSMSEVSNFIYVNF